MSSPTIETSNERANIAKEEDHQQYYSGVTRIMAGFSSIKEAWATTLLDELVYTSLPNLTSIRLLRMDNDHGKIPCFTLSTVDLGSEPRYCALSYTWTLDRGFGHRIKTGKPQLIRCNDKKVLVGRNLYNALLRLQHLLDGTWIWVDQICIDQKNIDERAQQVSMMSTIYEQADMVYVWLGESSFTTKKALKVLNAPRDRVKDLFDLLTYKPTITPSFGQASDKASSDGPGGLPIWQMLASMKNMIYVQQFMFRNWFSRTWIIQEVVKARNIRFLIGNDEISEDSVINGLKYVMSATKAALWNTTYSGGAWTETEWVLYRFHTALTVLHARKLYKQGQSWPLHHWLLLAWNTEASDARDKVYAILSLAQPRSLQWTPPRTQSELTFGSVAENQDSIVVDYSKSPREVFIACAKCLLFGEIGLFVLSLASRATIRHTRVGVKRLFTPHRNTPGFKYGVDNLPSWVPDFTIPPQPKPLLHIQWDQEVPFF